ncbi:DNA-nicking endonuclease, Smr domain [Rhizobium sp. RU20A]|uniref:Smr/MutS family protein n=1 Tax=Rhizobium sp. RU20A TaxID=1907412 RepID=UPI00095582B1|nr:Smr/MutS family protein [Rhizobium sp. RU20A]SIQ84269.1 DNA-nicking endonuclease, Smr domain [Rhizobium sp. RU20A]
MAKGKTPAADDRVLWGKVARTVNPLPGRKAELDAYLTELMPPDPKPEPAPQTAKSAAATKSDLASGVALTAKKPDSPRIHHPLERPVKRKLQKGRLQLEARIDLHGLIQSEAHGLLLHFLMQAHQRGLRHVLVITGKGASFGSDGALKRAVPLWFSLPEFRQLISSYEPAARNHGGDGALYVRLARRAGGHDDPAW